MLDSIRYIIFFLLGAWVSAAVMTQFVLPYPISLTIIVLIVSGVFLWKWWQSSKTDSRGTADNTSPKSTPTPTKWYLPPPLTEQEEEEYQRVVSDNIFASLCVLFAIGFAYLVVPFAGETVKAFLAANPSLRAFLITYVAPFLYLEFLFIVFFTQSIMASIWDLCRNWWKGKKK